MRKKPRIVRTVIITGFTSLLLITTACQPTPEQPIVVGKNDGVLEGALAQQPSAGPTPYDVPERLQVEVEGLPENFSILIDAKTEVSQSGWPVYTVEPATVTQEDADAVRRVLLGDAVLYKPGEYRSREEIEQSINYYEKELQGSVGYPDLIDSYKEILKNLYIEYESTPENLVLEEADTEFQFMEDQVQLRPDFFNDEKEVVTEDGGIQSQWTDEARQAAIEAGCENIYGVCWMNTGRKMTFSAQNGINGSNIHFCMAEGNLVQDPGVSCSQGEAIEEGNKLLDDMGFDFTLVDTQTWMQGEFNNEDEYIETGQKYHELTYKRSIEGVPQDNIVSCINQNIGEDYRSPIPSQETIIIQIDDDGVRLFNWNSPMTVVALENSNAPLIPFDEISERIASQLKVEMVWDGEADNEAEWIDSRCLKVDKIVLSYMMVAKSNDMMSYYLIPVWNVCGDLIYHYIDSYPIGESNTWVLDENNERHPWRSRGNMDEVYSILTINAIDGSVIPRYRWC